MNAPPLILLVYDSETTTAVVSRRLEDAGYRVHVVGDGRAALRAVYDIRPDVVLLDVVMPVLDGWQTLAMIRQISDVPVIILSWRDSELERVRGLKSGADDYVCKPFGPAELTARVAAQLRRSRRSAVREPYDDGVVRLDVAKAEVSVRGRPVHVTPGELRLLATLTAHAGTVLSPERLLELAWNDETGINLDRVRLYVRYLRAKIERDPARPELIENVRGFGYRYRAPLTQPAA